MPCQTIRWERGRRWFTWSNARGQPHGLPGGRGLSTAYEAADRHVDVGHGEAVALRCPRRDDTLATVTRAELARRSDRFAAGLRSLSIGPGGRVCTLLGRGPDLLTVVLGTLKNTSVRCRRKGAGVWEQFPGLWHVLIVGEGAEKLPDTQSFDELMSATPPEFTIPPTDGEDMALPHCTRCTIAAPKGALHVHDAVLAHLVSARSGRPRAREPTGATLTVTLVGFGAVTDRPCARNGLLGEVDSLDYLQFVEVLSGPAGVRLDEDDRLIASRAGV